MKKSISTALLITACTSLMNAQQDPQQAYKGKIGKTLGETQQWWPEKKKAPVGAPNVVWILLDDVGYGAVSSFGGLIDTPTLDSLANQGLRYTNFHTTAICAPTRAALLTGRNSHSVHMGLFPENAVGTPGYDARMPFEKATVAEILKENGYNTYALGKWHITPLADLTAAGPFNRWPTGRGFEHFYGYPYRGSSDQWHPQIWEDTRRSHEDTQGKHFNTLLADKAIGYISEQQSAAPEKPFFLYLATGAGHAPHQVAKEWSDRYKGKFDGGWDKYREEVLARQIKLGVVPRNTVLPPRNPGIKDWNTLPANEKKLYARFMEVYAGFLTQTDYEIGRIVKHLKKTGQLDNTLIFVSVGDNGASKEGTFVGVVNNYGPALSEDQILQKNIENIDLIGTEFSKPNYPLGWAMAANTPFRYWKQDANTEGGTHNPLIVFYPKGIKDEGGIRPQYGHVIDVLPTTLDLIHAQVPASINGYKQESIEGTSLAYSIDNATAVSKHTIQHYEVKGSRSIYKDGWKAGALHKDGDDFNKDVWELYNLNEDFNERTNLAAKHPEKLKELQAVFDEQAYKFNVYPLKDLSTPIIGPTIFDGKDLIVLYPGVSTIVELAAPDLRNKSFTLTADVEIPAAGAEGVLFSTGGRDNGTSFYVQDQKLNFIYNVGWKKFYVTSSAHAIAPGKAALKFDFKYDGGKAAGGTGTLFINGAKVGEARIDKTSTSIFGHEGLNLGFDDLTPVSDTYKVPFAFTGTLNKVTIELKKQDAALTGSR
ncbi:arylsulfatase [Chryseolinea lacunae]|uniref:Arylsulfatase n=1 Tax=Chryseolinea lacunae TaxID=2801331 RepID=A0ABS1KTY8_9BACT|nr:arylsulfatase [Chryseolinea lacunae]MBL0742707.1 arylsulfatase [Chryseolinea lacunae]